MAAGLLFSISAAAYFAAPNLLAGNYKASTYIAQCKNQVGTNAEGTCDNVVAEIEAAAKKYQCNSQKTGDVDGCLMQYVGAGVQNITEGQPNQPQTLRDRTDQYIDRVIKKDVNEIAGKVDNVNTPNLTFKRVAVVIVDLLVLVTAVLSAFFLVLGGIRYASSSGNPKNIEGAKNTITYAIIGLILAILAKAIVDFVVANLPK